jgi:excisionase family DNA binding protein
MKPEYGCPHCSGTGVNVELLLEDVERARMIEASGGAIGVSVETAALLISVSKRTMTKLVVSGEIPSRKIGTRTVIRRAALEEYLRDGEQGGQGCQSTEDDVFGKRNRQGVRKTAPAASTKVRTGTGRRR